MIPTMKIGKKIEKSLCMILWIFRRIQTKTLPKYQNQRLSKYNKKREKKAANIVVRPTLSRVSILVLKTVVEISKNFKESNMYQKSWKLLSCIMKFWKFVTMYHSLSLIIASSTVLDDTYIISVYSVLSMYWYMY